MYLLEIKCLLNTIDTTTKAQYIENVTDKKVQPTGTIDIQFEHLAPQEIIYTPYQGHVYQENMSVKRIPPHTPLLYRKTGVCKGKPIFLIFAPKH